MTSSVRFAVAAALALVALPAPALTLKAGTAWPSPEIPVCWEAPRPEQRQERDLIRKSVAATWERESAVRFTGWRACAEGEGGIRVSLEKAHPSAAGRGTELDGAPRGVRLPALWSLAALSVNMKAPVHEFGHALGFGHEYARPDAPEPERCGLRGPDGRPYLEGAEAVTPFDPDSIMVACVAGATAAFSRGLPVLSALDIFGLVRVYGPHPANVLGRDRAGDRFGAAILVRDFDGDGVVDLAVGGPGKRGGEGAVFLYHGHPQSGFRPWRRVSADAAAAGARAFGRDLGWQDVGGRLVVHADGPAGPLTVALDVSGAPNGPAGAARPAAVPARPAALRPAGSEGFGFPPPERWGAAINLDLDGDGLPDRIVGAPDADAGAAGSGAVAVFRGTPGGGLAPWYWFGQAH